MYYWRSLNRNEALDVSHGGIIATEHPWVQGILITVHTDLATGFIYGKVAAYTCTRNKLFLWGEPGYAVQNCLKVANNVS